jgi:phosphoribosylamine---glycine ligase
MKLLVIGGGGREHALAWRLAQGARVQKVFVAPGNAGTAGEPGVENIDITDPDKLADFAVAEQIHLTVVGPEAPLAAGVVDLFRSMGLKIFGPTKAAAQLESSKDFAKRFMQRHRIPTAGFETFADAAAAHAYITGKTAPIVIKADGLAAGKGVIVAQTLDAAHAAIDSMLRDRAMGNAGARVVIEDYLEGEEASFIVMVDGEHILPLATSQDHKRLQDGDLGPNTGGMGAYSPAPIVTPAIHARVIREIIQPAVAGMARDGIPYTGFLYAGLMIDKSGAPHTIEFNCRLGDPETQPIMMRLKSDFFEIVEHAVGGTLNQVEVEWDRRVALGIVYAAANYPGTPRTGDPITGLPSNTDDAHVFHAATALKAGKLVASGGRVLCVTALGDSVKMAQRRAYQYAEPVRFDGMQFRRDIGHRGVTARKS